MPHRNQWCKPLIPVNKAKIALFALRTLAIQGLNDSELPIVIGRPLPGVDHCSIFSTRSYNDVQRALNQKPLPELLTTLSLAFRLPASALAPRPPRNPPPVDKPGQADGDLLIFSDHSTLELPFSPPPRAAGGGLHPGYPISPQRSSQGGLKRLKIQWRPTPAYPAVSEQAVESASGGGRQGEKR